MGRVNRWLPIAAILALFGFAIGVVGMASAESGGVLDSSGDRAQPYQEGPLERRAEATLEWPAGAEELLALGMLTAILCGFRASGLARQRRIERPASAHTSSPESGTPRASTG